MGSHNSLSDNGQLAQFPMPTSCSGLCSSADVCIRTYFAFDLLANQETRIISA